MVYVTKPAKKEALEKDIQTVLKLAQRKDGASPTEILKALGLPINFMNYRYRQVLQLAKERGLKQEGHSGSTRYVTE